MQDHPQHATERVNRRHHHHHIVTVNIIVGMVFYQQICYQIDTFGSHSEHDDRHKSN